MIRILNSDVLVLLSLLRGRSNVGTHQQRLEAFYAPQADQYDRFRERLLHGREELIDHLHIVPELSIIELGGGTGHNLHYLHYPLPMYSRIEVVDLCPSLLRIARERLRGAGNVHVIEADAGDYMPSIPVDRVYFSYALTMIPDWRKAIDNALGMLKPGGLIGVVDFYVSSEQVAVGGVRHDCFTRRFWPRWFAHDGVMLTPEHLCYLRNVCRPLYIREARGRVPYLPFLQVPYYVFVGQAR